MSPRERREVVMACLMGADSNILPCGRRRQRMSEVDSEGISCVHGRAKVSWNKPVNWLVNSIHGLEYSSSKSER